MLAANGFTSFELGPRVDTFGGAPGEDNARKFGTFGVSLRAWKDDGHTSRVEG